MKTFLSKLGLLVLVLLPFMDAESKKVNRCYDRFNGAQLEEMIITINHLQKPIK